MSEKSYLGDSVYVEYSNHEFLLTTQNGHGPTNLIVLDSQIIEHLYAFYKSMFKNIMGEGPNEERPRKKRKKKTS